MLTKVTAVSRCGRFYALHPLNDIPFCNISSAHSERLPGPVPITTQPQQYNNQHVNMPQ